MKRSEDQKLWVLKKLSVLNTNSLRVTGRIHTVKIFGFERTTTLKTIQEQKEYLKKLI